MVVTKKVRKKAAKTGALRDINVKALRKGKKQ